MSMSRHQINGFFKTCSQFLMLHVKHVDLLALIEFQTVNKFLYYVLQL